VDDVVLAEGEGRAGGDTQLPGDEVEPGDSSVIGAQPASGLFISRK